MKKVFVLLRPNDDLIVVIAHNEEQAIVAAENISKKKQWHIYNQMSDAGQFAYFEAAREQIPA